MNTIDANIFADRAEADIANGNLSAAIRHFTAAIRLQPGEVRYGLMLARCCEESGDLKKAESVCADLIQAGYVQAPVLAILARLYFISGLYDSSVACLRKIAELDPQNPVAIQKLTNVLLALGQGDDAEKICEFALLENPGDELLLFQMGQVKQATGKILEAEAYYQRISGDTQSGAQLKNAGLGYLLLGLARYNEARALFQDALGKQPRDEGLANGLISAHLGNRNYKAAAEIAQIILQLNPTCAMAKLAVSIQEERSGTGSGKTGIEALHQIVDNDGVQLRQMICEKLLG